MSGPGRRPGALERFHTDFHLLDAAHGAAGCAGGTGETFDWELLAARRSNVPLILSGGLTPGQRGGGDRATQPFAVDVASGTEAAPGRKDPAQAEAFFAARSRGGRRARDGAPA